jgi:tRNA (guanine37-N1)-methyltransferase
MLRIDFVTLFPEMVLPALQHSILKRAVDKQLVQFGAANPRDFATDKHRTVDNEPYGGGPGMLMMPGPVSEAITSLLPGPDTAIVVTEPTGAPFTQQVAAELAARPRIIFVCGHYEGIDDRIRQRYATHVISIGDFVLTGGELPALVMTDAIVRLLRGALGKAESLEIDSHSDGLLSAPQYTRPEVWEDMAVPEVLRSGDHGAIAKWRREQALRLTRELRPDLFCTSPIDKKDVDLLSS